MDVPHSPLVSVIITTKNEERNIENCLRGVACQTYPNIEAIVVDNFSTDKTKEIARKYTDKVSDKGPERSAQRNYGIAKACGSFILFLDADMIAAPDLVVACVERMKEDGIVGLYVPEIVLGSGFWANVRRFERGFYDGTPIDAARFFTKESFDRAGGFDENFYSAEDWDFDKKLRGLGKVATLADSGRTAEGWPLSGFIEKRGVNSSVHGACVYHNEADFKLFKYLLKKNYYAKGFAAYIAKWGKDDLDVQKQFGFWYRYLGVFVENGKWKRLLSRPDLTVGMYFLRVLVGGIYALRQCKS